jgi:hypothetical protein
MVVVKTQEADVTFKVPMEVMRTISPVLAGFLDDGKPATDDEELTTTVDDVPAESVEAFLDLGMLMCHQRPLHGMLHGDDSWYGDMDMSPSQKVVEAVPLAMELVHKYDARGMLNFAQVLVDLHPTKQAVLAVLKYADSIDWMSAKTKDFAVREAVFTRVSPSRNGSIRSITSEEKQNEASILADLPQPIMVSLLTHLMDSMHLKKHNGAELISVGIRSIMTTRS